MNKEHAEVLSNILNDTMKVQRVERLFRASEHDFRAKAFHQKCDNQEDTLVLIRNEFGKTFGGFTHYPWSSANRKYINDRGRRAFLFSLDMGEKFVPQEDDKLIYCSSDRGPIFGGKDIFIFDGCNSHNKSFANFPTTYNRANGK